MKQPKLVQLVKMLCKWLTAVCLEGEPMTGPMIIKEAKFLNEDN